MIICFYLFVPLLFLPVDSSSIRDRSFKNDLVPSLISRSDPSKKDRNSLKIVSNEPFIIQLQMPNTGESTRRNGKDKDTKRKRPTKKRVSKIKPLRRHRQRRDLQTPEAEADKHRKSNPPDTPQAAEHQSKNATKNSISRVDILKALSSFPKEREANRVKKYVKTFRHVEENRGEGSENVDDSASGGNSQRVSSSPFVKMVYPSAPKTEKRLHKYTYKDLMSDRDRLEKKIKYIRNMLNASAADDMIRVRRRSESDRTANKIAKMFLTLSAVNGMHDKLKPKCDNDDDDDDDDDGYRVQDIWEKEREDSPSRKSSSSNEERYKVKKWIEHMKNKRSSSKSCPCMTKGHDEEGDVFPLEQKLPKNYYLFEKGGSSEESSEVYRDPSSFDRDKPNKNFKRRNLKVRDDHEKKMKGLGGKGRKLELPLDDLETYRMKAKQILQNAEEILDKIKEEEEKRVSMPNVLLSQLKELTSRIQTDPRNNENDLIRKIQKNLGWGPTTSPDGADGSTFLENVKSFILDPYEKAKALTDESTKKLSSYLLRNLGELKESGEMKEQANEGRDSNGEFGEAMQEEKMKTDSIVEKAEEKLSRSKEDLENWADTVSSILGGDEENKKPSGEDQFKKRMEEMIKEQEKKLNEFEVTGESEESSKERSSGNGEEKQHETADHGGTLRGDAVAAPLGEKKHRVVIDVESEENDKREKMGEKNASKESDYVSGKEIVEGEKDEEAAKRLKEEEVEKEVLKEIAKEFDEKEKDVEPDYPQSGNSKGEKEESKGANEDDDPVESVHKKSADEEEVDAAAPEEKETDPTDARNRPKFRFITSFSAEASLEGGESSEETLLGRQEELETKADTEKKSAEELNETSGVSAESKETVGASDVVPNKGDGLQKETEVSHREVEPQKVMEYADLIQEANEEKSLEKMKENEEEDEEKNEDEALRQDGYSRDGGSIREEEDADDVQASKTADRLDGDDSKESLEESGREVLGSLEKNAEGSPLASATSEESSGEVSYKHLEDEASMKNEKPPEEPADEGGAFLKEANEGEGTQHSVEEGGGAPLKATMNERSDEKDTDVNVATTGVETTSEEVDEEPENAEGSSETLLKSAVDKSREEPERNDEESSGKSAGAYGAGSEEDGESQDVNEEADSKLLKSEKSSLGAEDGDSGSVKERGSSRMISEEKNGEDSVEEEEETGLKATGPTRELGRENSYEEEPGAEGEKGTALGSQELTDLKDKTEEDPSERSVGTNEDGNKSPNWDATTGETLKASLEEKGQENLGEDDAEETRQQAATKSDEESKMVRESSRNEADEKSEEVEAVLDDRNTENGDGDEEGSLGVTNNEESVKANLDAKEDDDEVSLKATLDDDDQVTTGEVDDDAKKRVDEGSDDENLMRSLNNDDLLKEDTDETSLRATEPDVDTDNDKEENQDTSEGMSDDIPLRATINNEADETPLKAAMEKDEENLDDADETPVRAAVEKNEENLDDADETPVRAAMEKDEETDETPLRAAVEKNEENLDDADETPLRAAVEKDEESLEDDPHLRATINKNDEETLDDADETSLRTANTKNDEDDDDFEDAENSNEGGNGETAYAKNEITEGTEDGETLRAENPQMAHQGLAGENPSRAASPEEFNNVNNIYDSDETPLRSTNDDLNDAEATKVNSEESLTAANIQDDVSNQTDGKNEDGTPLKSAKSLDGVRKESEDDHETFKKENPSEESEESEDYSPAAAAGPVQRTKSRGDRKKQIPSDSLKLHPLRNPKKAGKLKVPTSIAKIMKDLEGQEKDDITAIENLNPEKIDHIIDKIDEVEQQNKVTDEVDCRKECACAEDINTRSRNRGRYEIVRDFLQWMKDLQLNRVLSDD